jgi:hypothetical protein
MKKPPPDFTSKLYYRACCLALFFVAAAASFNGYFEKWHFLDADKYGFTQGKCFFEPMVDGTATRPYVYRQLLPMVANWIDGRVGQQTRDWLWDKFDRETDPLQHNAYHPYDSPVAQNRAYFLRYRILHMAVFLFAWISTLALYLVGKAVGFPPAAAALAAVGTILMLPCFFSVAGYYYDYPELAFLSLAVWMALKFDWWWIIPVAALATWNKESFLLFIPALYPLLRLRSSRPNALAGTAVLGLVCAGVYCLIWLHFRHNPGGTVEFHFLDQLQFLRDPSNLLARERTYGLTTFKSFSLLPLALIVWTAWRGWRSLPRAVQRHAQIAAAINFPLFFLFCAPGELRDLSLLYITLLLLLAANITVWMQRPEKRTSGHALAAEP